MSAKRIEEIFAQLRDAGGRGLMPFLCAGRPSLEALPELLLAVEEAGAHIVEVGFPFSDPIADGPVIAQAMHRALQQGVTPAGVFEAVADARSQGLGLGLVAMVSVSIVHRMGLARFACEAAQAGFDGLIVPDCPVEESDPLAQAAQEADLTLSLLAAPTSSDARLARIADRSSGFVYLLARLGVTGARDQAPSVEEHVARLRRVTDLPVACGFGVASAEHVARVVAHADAAIVGSALVERIERAGSAADAVEQARRFVRELARGLPQTRVERS